MLVGGGWVEIERICLINKGQERKSKERKEQRNLVSHSHNAPHNLLPSPAQREAQIGSVYLDLGRRNLGRERSFWASVRPPAAAQFKECLSVN